MAGERISGAEERLSRLLAIDCGSTTTKAILFGRFGDGWRLEGRGEAPTTVEPPVADVMQGVWNAIAELEEVSGIRLAGEAGGTLVRPATTAGGVDAFVATSSAGGGLQVLVAGIVRAMSAESAQRAALGAGAIVVETLAVDDGRPAWERIERIRSLRPDLILLSGGVDGGATAQVFELAELLVAAAPKPRLPGQDRVPLLYAGNAMACDALRKRLSDAFSFDATENIRPTMEQERLGPARRDLQASFLEHVMRQAPGYAALVGMTDTPVLPTPAAVGELLERFAAREGGNVVAIDIGGATTDVFSIIGGVYRKTVAANLGMSYSMGNVAAEAGYDAVMRWLPVPMDEEDARNILANKMLRPTTIPDSREELLLEQATAREAIRLAFGQHRSLAAELKGTRREGRIDDLLSREPSGESVVHPGRLGLIIGSGGVLSHAPSRGQAAAILIDAVQPEGITALAVDSVFMMPHLGAMSRLDADAALDTFDRECLVRLGACIAPTGTGNESRDYLDVKIEIQGKELYQKRYIFGAFDAIPLGPAETAGLTVTPSPALDMGAGPGKTVRALVRGGAVGIVIDLRGRPLNLPNEATARAESIRAWLALLETAAARAAESAISLRTVPLPGPETRPERAYVPGLALSGHVGIRKIRRLPVPGEVLVRAGDPVGGEQVIARALLPGAAVPVPLAGPLGCLPGEVGGYLKMPTGAPVRAGEPIAEVKGWFGLFSETVVSPADGLLESVSPLTGHALVRLAPTPVDLVAHVSGVVLEVHEGGGAVIACDAAFIQGVFGVGGEARGPLTMAEAGQITGTDAAKAILVFPDPIDAGVLDRAAAAGVAGVITGSLPAQELERWLGLPVGRMLTGAARPPFPLVLTEGFGSLPMSERASSLLHAHRGRAAAIDGTTQIRAGSIRPEIVIPLDGAAGASDGTATGHGLRIGSEVRLIRGSRFGAFGRVTALPEIPAVLATGARVRVAELHLPAGDETIVVPRANLEIIAS
ncbi:MAG TPA: glutamate mutase L [Candidatus Ozemobacteraceae bacterium]|nr:glutamate mutase L [Candidatus Ozemobacteraceae bacterium]